MRAIGYAYVAIPFYRVHVDCKYLNGPIVVGLVSTLPIDGIDLLIDFITCDDIAGDKVLPIVQNTPAVDAKTESLEDTNPGIFLNCVVTKSQAKVMVDLAQNSVNSTVNIAAHTNDENENDNGTDCLIHF